MLAPIALHPDPLLAQMLVASTYTGDVSDALVLVPGPSRRQGRQRAPLVANEPWDASVQAGRK